MLKANSSDDFGITTPIIDILFLLVMVFFSLLFFSQVENYHVSSSSPGLEATSKYSKESLDKLSKENEYRYKEIKQKQKQTQKMEAELAYLKKSVPSKQTIEDKKHIPIETQIESEKLTKETENTRQIVAKLQQQVATFEKERTVLEEMRTDLLGCDDELRRLCQRAARLTDQLTETQEHLLQPTKQTITVQSAPMILTKTERFPIYVALVDGKVVPVQEPFYSIANKVVGANGHYDLVIHHSRVRDGESIDQVLQGNSVFSKLAESLNPEKQYIAFLVDSSSFETFRTVREVLRNQGTPFGWEPLRCDGLNLSSNGKIVNQINEGM